MACFCVAGRWPSRIDALIIAVRYGRSTSTISFSRKVGMGSSVQDFVGDDKIAGGLTSSSVHAFSSVSSAVVDRGGKGAGGGQLVFRVLANSLHLVAEELNELIDAVRLRCRRTVQLLVPSKYLRQRLPEFRRGPSLSCIFRTFTSKAAFIILCYVAP